MQSSLQRSTYQLDRTTKEGSLCCRPVITPVNDGRPPHCPPDKVLQEGIRIVAELDTGPMVDHTCKVSGTGAWIAFK